MTAAQRRGSRSSGSIESSTAAPVSSSTPSDSPFATPPRDRELVGLLTACLAYGRVDLFSGQLEGILARMGRRPPRSSPGSTRGARRRLRRLLVSLQSPARPRRLLHRGP
jgi:hypothetical protein